MRKRSAAYRLPPTSPPNPSPADLQRQAAQRRSSPLRKRQRSLPQQQTQQVRLTQLSPRYRKPCPPARAPPITFRCGPLAPPSAIRCFIRPAEKSASAPPRPPKLSTSTATASSAAPSNFLQATTPPLPRATNLTPSNSKPPPTIAAPKPALRSASASAPSAETTTPPIRHPSSNCFSSPMAARISNTPAFPGAALASWLSLPAKLS